MIEDEYKHITTEIGVSPISFNLAIVPINSRGSLGELNLSVIKTYGYSTSDIDEIDISNGYYVLDTKRNKPIIFIVTVGKGNPGISLKNNLTKALEENKKLLKSKKVWVPLMATGAGGMEFVDSYDTTIGVLKQFPQINFTISIPNDKRGNEFINNFKTYNLRSKEGDELTSNSIEGSIRGKSTVTGALTNKKTNSKDDFEQNKINTAELEYLNLVNVNYFLAGHIWGDNNQMPRFIKDNVWENGHDNIDTDLVNTAKKGDVIFLKSSFAKKNVGILRIKSVGVITSNKEDGHNLDVNWYKFKNQIDIEGLSKYRSTFARIMKDDLSEILGNVVKKIPDFKNVYYSLTQKTKSEKPLQKETEPTVNITTIAGLISDADSGKDYLDISKDVNAFAKVMSAKSFSPPLAIALLGKWGSGKSFFMRKLKERIQNLSKSNNTQNAYCNGIAHVHFNAWSYMDSNLWAGIITKIFEGLQEYITNDSLASINKKEIEKALTKKLNIAHDEITDLEHQKQSVDKKIKTLESQKGKAEGVLKGKIDEIKSKSIKTVLNKLDESFKISEKVSSALSSNDSFNKSADNFSEIVPREYWQNPTELYKKTKSKYTFVRTFFKGANWKKSIAWFCIILILVISMKTIVFLGAKFIGIIDFTFPSKAWYYISLSGAFIYRNYKTFKHLQPLISSFWKIKEDYELQKKDAIFKVNQAEKALKFEIANYKTEIQTINEQINQAKQSKLEIEYRLENTLTTEALFNFIEKRSVSDDYKKHLGIVSIIRKDFEILSELFSGHHDELNNSKESEEFKKKFNKPLERIILYIDDLDRCSDERVVQVLEAVNLLMAYPLFVVVVGVDPRWVKNALIKKHQLQFSNNGDRNDNMEMIEPSAYLEKIFQVPFQLKSATDDSVKHMLKTLAESRPESEIVDENFIYDEEGEPGGYYDAEDEELKEGFDRQAHIISIEETIESLKFSDKEIQLLQSMSEILGANPRALKRFVNIYRVIKAHEDFNYTNESEEGELLSVMFLIALPLGKYKKLASSFQRFIKNSQNDESNLLSFTAEKNLDELRFELINVLQGSNIEFMKQTKDAFRKHNTFINRFTFNNI
ncbi:P-loop NTPase fold protein [Lutibacter citreus]|uniref:P-loop NTPase fold protein n=1 Tax=Lutibacter citreus TaxID=2138210 RepID=UPI000DBE0813|nr:P-loop NTPase fold protein [Lutibacter citreus]